jgi:putative hydrolase of the HAD superfamily
MIKCVISDLGNVVLSFNPTKFYLRISKSSPNSQEQIAEIIRKESSLLRDFGTGKISPQEFYEKTCLKLQITTDYESFFSAYCEVFSLKLDVINTLVKLKTKYHLILLSNTDIKHFEFVRREFPQIFFFDDYVLSYEVGWMKPNPQIYKLALKRAKAIAEECTFIDDFEENISAAAKLGMHTILFKPQIELKTELAKLNISS